MIKVENARKVYGKKSSTFVALDSVSLDIEQGATVAIVGKSGSGKSTLMHLMSGLDPATSGQIIVDGQNLATMKRKEVDSFRNKTMGFIFQSFFVEANQSVLNNVSLPLEIAKIRKGRRNNLAKKAIEQVGLGDKSSAKARNLSGGQKQRLAIARAIVNSPKLIFADEPTGNLDSVTGKTIIELLFGLNKKLGSTLIIVTHDHDLAVLCDTQVFMKDGRIESIKKSAKNLAQKPKQAVRKLSI
ncbi:MAG: ABC transporter ATP-binding protein [bacterium]|nr:ABC transporter ATP-binding protein [bacterium]